MDFAITASPVMRAAVAAPFVAADDVIDGETSWTNPAAAAALLSTVDMLRTVEDGIVRNYASGDQVRGFAVDLRSTSEIFAVAKLTLESDASKENDAFIPLITAATGGVDTSAVRLSSKDIQNTWPAERNDILTAIRRARAIGQNVANQLDPRTPRDPR